MTEQKFKSILEVDDFPLELRPRRQDGRRLSRKTVGTDKVTGTISADSVDTDAIQAAAVTKSKVSYEVVDVTIALGNPSGTATVTSGSQIVGVWPTGNQDQLIDNVAISGTTLTITLAANATAQNTFKVFLLKA